VGTFKAPILPNQLDAIESQVGAVSEFIVGRVVPFLTQYDRRGVE
jgi:hypothetical protein